MSGALKALLGLAIVGAITAAVFSFLIVAKKNDLTTQITAKTTEVQSKETQIKKIQTDLKAKEDEVAEKDKAVTEAKSEVSSLKVKADDAEKKATALQASVTEAASKVKEAEAKVEQINSALAGKTPEQYKADVAKAQEELNAVRAEQRILQDQLQASKTEVDRLNGLVHNIGDGKLPPGITGKIETVNRTWNFVVLNVGDKDNVTRNGVLIVYRGNDYIGKVKVVSTEAHTAVADILPEWTKGDIQAGDDVLN
jgi:hypothetical protein